MSLYPAPGDMKSSISWEGGDMIISTPQRKAWLQSGFLLFWLAGWAAGELFAFASLLGGFPGDAAAPTDEMPASIFLLFWLAFWTLGGSVAIYQLLMRLFGRQVIRVNDIRLAVERRLFGIRFGKVKEYEAGLISGDLATGGSVFATAMAQSDEVPPPSSIPGKLLAKVPDLLPGMIVFSFGGEKVQIEMPNDDEAQVIVQQITSQYRVYAAERDAGDTW